ncbi:hypothetical protein [Streptomyces ginkgonis]|uniref:hypothetical protein n=1 Tax=Streptomyces ginkgonis TaxID=1812259 RepID=UPI002176E740|nr:hypothetical protein [Streptomyces ginkgonis]
MSAVRVVQEHGDELEADLFEFFNIDLLDLWRGRLSLRRVAVLIDALAKKPGRSTLLAAIDSTAAWSAGDYLLARVSDALDVSNYLFLKAHSADSAGIEAPSPLSRPGAQATADQPAAEAGFSSGADVAAFFERMNSM